MSAGSGTNFRKSSRHQAGQIRPPGAARGPAVRAVPPVPEGKVRCPVCRNVTRIRKSGEHLVRHRDLFGHDCYNVALPKPTT